MGPIAAIKLFPHLRRTWKAVELVLESKGLEERLNAADKLDEALVPLIEGFVGRDVVDDGVVNRAVHKIIDAVHELLALVQGVKDRYPRDSEETR